MPFRNTVLPGRRGAHELALMGSRRGEPFDHDVVLSDQHVQVAVPVRKCLPDHLPGGPHSLPIGGHAERRIMHHKVAREIGVDGPRSPSVNSPSMRDRTIALLS